MEDKENLRIMVEANLRSVTQSCKGGVLLDRLERDYRDLLGKSIPFRELGYSSLEAFLHSIPDVIKISRNNLGQLVAMAVADSTTAHIASLVARQKDAKPKKQPFRRPYRMPAQRMPVQRSPIHSKKFYSNPLSMVSRGTPLTNYQQKTSAAQDTRRNQVSPDNRKPMSFRKENIQKKTYEMPPRFLRSQKHEASSDLQVRTQSPVWDVDSSLPPPPLPTVIKPPVPQKTESFSGCNALITVQTAADPHYDNVKPKRTVCLPAPPVPVHLSAKGFIANYAKLHNIEPVYRTKPIGQKQKKYISTLILDGKKYSIYPEEAKTAEEAEEMAATIAKKELENRDMEEKFPEVKVDTIEEVINLIHRIEGIVIEKPNGLWSDAVPEEYKTKYSELLPNSWLDLMREHASKSIEFITQERIQLPKGACILRAVGSGTVSPTSNSSHASYAYEDDVLDPSQKALRMAFQGVPRLVLPKEDQWAVYVTSVVSTLEIAVNLVEYRDKFAEFHNKMTAFYMKQGTPVTKVEKKKFYVAQIIDDSCNYCRVRVEEVLPNSDLVTCYFVDVGDTEQLKLSQLYELEPLFEDFAFQAIHLQLHGLEEYANVIGCDHLIKYLLGKSLIAEIVGRGENKFTAKLHDTSGEDDVNLNNLLREVVIGESLVAELPPVGSTIMAYLSNVTGDGDVFLRPSTSFFHIFDQDVQKLAPTFELNTSTSPLTYAKPDTVYVAKYVDGKWYRAMLTASTEVTDDEVEVFYVDYGNTSWVPLSTICELEPVSKFLASLPFQIMRCTLSELPPASQWTEAAATKLYELAFDVELIVKVEHPGTDVEVPQVALFRRNENSHIISVNQTLAFDKGLFMEEKCSEQSALPVPSKPTTLHLSEHNLPHSSLLSSYIPDVAVPAAEVEVQKRQNNELNPPQPLLWTPTPEAGGEFGEMSTDSLPPINVPNFGDFDVLVALAASPSNFVVQPLDSAEQLRELQQEMKQFYSSDENICELHDVLLKKDMLYAALHSDGYWYRVRLKETQGDPVFVCVHFIDYGDYDVVAKSSLQVLYKRFQKLPAQAIRASLAGVKPRSKDWEPNECVSFKEQVIDRRFVSRIVRKGCTPEPDPDFNSMLLYLELIDTSLEDRDVFIHQELIEKGMALPS